MIEPRDTQSPDQSFSPPPPPWRQNTYNQPVPPVPLPPPIGGNFSGRRLPGVGDLLSQTWEIFVRNAGAYIGIAVLPLIVQIIGMVVLFFVLIGGFFIGGLQSLNLPFSVVSKATSTSSLLLLIAVGLVIIAVHILSQAALIYKALQREKRIGLGEAYGFAVGKLFSFLGIAILSIIIIGGGMFLFVIPGILFAIWFIFASFVLMGEDVRGMTALLRSREYVKGNGLAVFWRLFAFGLIIGLAFFAIYIGFYVIVGLISAVVKSEIVKLIVELIVVFALFIIQPIIMALNVIYSALIYEYLRAARPALAYAPSAAQKAIFLGIGILGWAFPLLGFAGIAGSLFSSFSKLKNSNSSFDLKNFQYNSNINFNSNINNNNQNSNSSLFQDTDKDGLSDSIEKLLRTNSNIADTDFDGLLDGEEFNVWGTNLTNPDTDGDGFRDGDEARGGYNPLGSGKTQNN